MASRVHRDRPRPQLQSGGGAKGAEFINVEAFAQQIEALKAQLWTLKEEAELRNQKLASKRREKRQRAKVNRSHRLGGDCSA